MRYTVEFINTLVPPAITNKLSEEHTTAISADKTLVIGSAASLSLGQSFALYCPVTGNPAPQLQWYRGVDVSNMVEVFEIRLSSLQQNDYC